MKIALIGTSASCVLGFRSSLIKELCRRGNTVYALALDYQEEERAMVRAMGAIPIDYNFSRTGLNPIRDLLNTFRLVSLLKSLSVDVAFSYFAKPVVFGTIAAWIAGVPRRVGMLEGLGYAFTQSKGGLSFKARIIRFIQVLLYRVAFPLLDQLVFLNPDDVADLISKYKLKVKNVVVTDGIGIDLKKFRECPPKIEPFTFLFIGRFLAEKGVREFVSAAKAVKASFPSTRFLMLGEVDLKNPGSLKSGELQSLIGSGIIEYPGYVRDVRPWLEQASVFVLPSYREGLPWSTQEAMAMGRAVITTDVPGCRQTVQDEKNGFLVPPWNVEKLSEKMIFFLKKPELAQTMGHISRKMAVSRFDSNKINSDFVRIILS